MGFLSTAPAAAVAPTDEFWFGGELRPWTPIPPPEEEYSTTWLRDNRSGPQLERWFHYAGCRRWFTVERDTRTNEILSTGALPRAAAGRYRGSS